MLTPELSFTLHLSALWQTQTEKKSAFWDISWLLQTRVFATPTACPGQSVASCKRPESVSFWGTRHQHSHQTQHFRHLLGKVYLVGTKKGTPPLWTAPLAWGQLPWKLSGKGKVHNTPGFPLLPPPYNWVWKLRGLMDQGTCSLTWLTAQSCDHPLWHEEGGVKGWGRGRYNHPFWQQSEQIQYFINHIPSWAVITVTQLTWDKILFLKSETQKSNAIFVKQARVSDLKPLYMVKPFYSKTTLYGLLSEAAEIPPKCIAEIHQNTSGLV